MTYKDYYNLFLIDAVKEALDRVGYRTSLAYLAEATCQVAYEFSRKYNLEQIGLHTMHREKSSNKQYDNQSIELHKNAIVRFENDKNNGTYPRPDLNTLSMLRRKLGGKFDCRTHYDVPDRNMVGK